MFSRGDALYRQVNRVYAENYTQLMESGLYAKLFEGRGADYAVHPEARPQTWLLAQGRQRLQHPVLLW